MAQQDKGPGFSLSWLALSRWNILDVIDFNRSAVATYLFAEIDMTFAEQLRERLERRDKKVTVTAIILKAIGIAQRHHPHTRTALLPWGQVVTFHNIVAGFTVERFMHDGPAVFLGTVHDPDTKSLQDIADELRQYGAKSLEDIAPLRLQNQFLRLPWLLRRLIMWLGMRCPQLRLACMGATFGVSSLGKYAVRSLIPPCVSASTFGVGVVEDRPVVRAGEVIVRPMMTLSLNFDHRLFDGAPAARFLQDVRELLEGGLERYLDKEEAEAAPTHQNISAAGISVT